MTSFLKSRTAIRQGPKLDDCSFYVLPKSIDESDASDVMTYYGHLRSYVEHEDGLINSRLTWSLTIDGFLFAVYGLCAGKIVDSLTELHKAGGTLQPTIHGDSQPLMYAVPVLLMLMTIVAIVGFLISLFAAVAIIAAHNALEHLTTIAHGEQNSEGGLFRLSRTRKTALPSAVDGAGARRVMPRGEDVASVEVREISMVSEVDLARERVAIAAMHAGSEDAPMLESLGHRMLLPKITGGGDAGRGTGGAREYYVRLPQIICCAWVLLAILAIAVLVGWLR